MHFTTTALISLLTSTITVSALNTLKVKDRHFVDSVTGNAFFVRGVDYQPGGSSGFQTGSDPLTDINGLARDIFLFQRLGINAIRIYSVDPSLNHDVGMSMLNAAGIYVFLDVNTPLEGQHLNAQVPWTTYTPAYLDHVFTVLEVFSGYDNLAGFLSGNEVVFEKGTGEWAPQYVKATTRDIKNYMAKHITKRQIPIGYANADVLDYRVSMADYMQCGPANEALDFFGVNSYQWCGADATFATSGYNTLVDNFSNYSLPLFFTEYGCNKPSPRVFNEVGALYSDQMTGVFSGGLVYQYNQDTNNYGLATVDTKTNSSTINSEFDALASQYAKVPSPTIPSSATNNPRPTTCTGPFPNINGTNFLPATLGQKSIDNGVSGSGKTWNKGAFVSLTSAQVKTTYQIIDSAGKTISDNGFNSSVTTPAGTAGGSSGDGGKKNAASTMTGSVGFSAVWSVLLMGLAGVAFM